MRPFVYLSTFNGPTLATCVSGSAFIQDRSSDKSLSATQPALKTNTKLWWFYLWAASQKKKQRSPQTQVKSETTKVWPDMTCELWIFYPVSTLCRDSEPGQYLRCLSGPPPPPQPSLLFCCVCGAAVETAGSRATRGMHHAWEELCLCSVCLEGFVVIPRWKGQEEGYLLRLRSLKGGSESWAVRDRDLAHV